MFRLLGNGLTGLRRNDSRRRRTFDGSGGDDDGRGRGDDGSGGNDDGRFSRGGNRSRSGSRRCRRRSGDGITGSSKGRTRGDKGGVVVAVNVKGLEVYSGVEKQGSNTKSASDIHVLSHTNTRHSPGLMSYAAGKVTVSLGKLPLPPVIAN